MDKKGRRLRNGHRAIVFAVLAMVVIVTTAVGTRLTGVPPSLPRAVQDWLILLLGGALLAFAAVTLTFLAWVIRAIWRQSESDIADESRLFSLLDRLGQALWQPRSMIHAAVALAALIPLAWVMRPFTQPDLEPGPMKLMIAFKEGQAEVDVRQMLVDQWNQAHPENQVTIEPVPDEPDAQHKKMVSDAKGRQEADIYGLDIVWMPEFIEKDYIRPLDESLLTPGSQTDIHTKVLETCKDMSGRKKGLWALPLNTDAGLLFYRSDLKLSVPDTWDGYFGEAAKKTFEKVSGQPELKNATGKLLAANAAQFANEEILTIVALEAIWAAGGNVVDKNGQLVRDADNNVSFDDNDKRGLRELSLAYQREGALITEGETAATRAHEDIAKDAFKSGQTLFMRNWSVTYDKLKSESGEKFEVAALPHTSVLGGQNLAISRSTEKPRAAQAFIEFLASAPSQTILFELGGYAPTRPSVISQSTRSYGQALQKAIDRARHRPMIPNYTDFSKKFRAGVLHALNNKGEPSKDFSQVLAEAAR